MATQSELPEIRSMGRSVFDPIWAQQEHVDENAELLHVLRGKVVVQTRGYRIVGNEGDTIYTPSGMPHRDIFPAGSVFEVYLTQFRWAGEGDVLGRFTPPQLAQERGPVRARLADQCHKLYEEFCTSLPYGRELAAARLLKILLSMCREAELSRLDQRAEKDRPGKSSTAKRGRREGILELAKRLMQDNYAQPLSLDWLAEKLNVSPYYLSRVFSEESGFRLSDYLTSLRMDQARHFLADGRLRVAQVAHAVGYRDPHYFAKVFRGHFKQSPSAFRLSLAAKKERR
ncbi:MAG: AraC family transcriptional regulator [Phycisphaeraceae bacterium]|nr:AraC family transcriptional regulator [Phycisphaeraceae bacterium]